MKLSYRGVAYEYTSPVVETFDGEVSGFYRGAAWKLMQVKQVLNPQPTYELKYRGISYGDVHSSRPQPQIATEPAIAASL